MRTFALMGCLVAASVAGAQSGAIGPSVSSSTVSAELGQALVGDWVGVLEYRDYSEPAGSTKRVQLPTWLTTSAAGDGLGLHFVYDDGPTKTVVEDDVWTFDAVGGSFSEAANGKVAQVYAVTGFSGLKSGRGELVMTGRTVDNDKSAESRITLTVRRNLVAWTEEVRPAGSGEGFAFRHRFVFTRRVVPVVGR